MRNQNINKLTTTIFLFLITLIGTAQAVEAQQAAPTLRIVLPERFRVITNQYFDLRVEAEGLSRTTARVLINVEGDGGGSETLNFAGANEITTDNDNNPLTQDKAWTYRRVSFTTPGYQNRLGGDFRRAARLRRGDADQRAEF